jgi:diaminohydroxyphosphoribosylaminopyrimidine deaminase / 5-amino-6-(5-phosphoribosylamino)uracil reductase
VNSTAPDHERFMARALVLAARGQGSVEPNPMVGCVLARDGQVVGEGYHQQYGGPHAEVLALQEAGPLSVGATAYVTLEPCSHQGKTPPCTAALLHGRVVRVVAAMEDPFPPVDGSGFEQLREAGVVCQVGILADEARRLNAPYLKRLMTGQPWVVAKWAMTRDGQLALPADQGRWISNKASQAVVQQLRGRMDAIVVGSGTARTDNPLLTARPANPADVRRVATRVVVDSLASLALESQLVKTAHDVPVLVAVSAAAPVEKCRQLVAAGVDIAACAGASYAERLESLLSELGARRMTNVLVEGGSRLLRTLFDIRAVDEVHVFVAPKDAGAVLAPAPVADVNQLALVDPTTTDLDGDLYTRGRVKSA